METGNRNQHQFSQRSTEENTEGCYQVPLAEDRRYSVHYVPQGRMHKYDIALKSLLPVRNQKSGKGAVPIDQAGLLSTIYSFWMSKYIWKAYKTGFNVEDLPETSPYDCCNYNVQRLELLWQNELGREGPTKASFAKVAWRFIRTRLYVSMFLLTVSLILGFISPTILMRNLLEFVQSVEGSSSEGIKWAVLLTLCEILRTTFFTWSWVLNYRTAARLKAASAALLYRKVIRLNGLGQKSYGELVNLFAKDIQKFSDAILFGTMIISGPVVIICGMTYVGLVFTPIALLGMITFFLFYPLQYLLSRLSAFFRRKAIYVADTRVKLINEVFTSMKVVKMYAYEKLFGERLLDNRRKEEKLLRNTAYCQSLSISLSPAVPMISAMAVFLVHTSLGNNLKASQAFPVVALYGPMMRLALSSLRDVTRYLTDALLTAKRLKVFSLVTVFSALIRSTFMYTQAAFFNIVEAFIALNRLKEVMVLEENSSYVSKPIVKSQAVAIVNGTFVQDVVEPQLDTKKKSKKKKYRRREGKMSVNTQGRRKAAESDSNWEAKETDEFRRKEESARAGSTSSIGTKRIEVLADITFEGAKGKLVGICGAVGSGKTSLLLGILGQLRMTRGQLMRDGTCAYVSQEPWIVNATLKENILFGETFDGKRYYSAITVSCLKEDLDLLPAGDETEIGERGINLSGGQKQRVALARALYANRDIYLLDDPLSAVDTHVGTCIFENLILGALKDKAVIFVTHQVQFLKHCEYVYMLNAGRIVEHGTHEELIRLDREYAMMIGHHGRNPSRGFNNEVLNERQRSSVENTSSHLESAQGPAGSAGNAQERVKSREAGAVLIAEERKGTGSVKPDTYIAYVLAAGGYSVAFLVLIAFLLNTGSIAFSNWWLAYWIRAGGGNVTVSGTNETRISENITDNPDFEFYRSVYASFIAVILLTSFIRGLSITFSTVRASTTLYKLVLERMISAPLRFFETTPIGRLQHIFSRDIDDVDSYLPGVLENLLQNLFVTVFALGFITGVFPWYIIPLLLLGAIFYFISRMFRAAIRDLKRIENITRSPLLSFVSTTVHGLSTIQAFEKKKEFIKRFDDQTDLNTLCQFMCNLSMRWLSVRLDYLAVISMSATAFLVVVFKEQVPAALAGLALTYCAQISGIFQFTVRLISEAEARFISVERINYYIRSLQREGERDGVGSGKTDNFVKPPEDWPSRGRVKFESIHLKYREELPTVLNGVSFSAAAGEKIGILGRTGSGKSSLFAALLRTVEISSGRITIDGIDISRVEQRLLRSKLSIIPQDPVLFSGTVRSNVDPYNTHQDEEIWEALEKTQLKDRVTVMPGGLEAPLEFDVTNLSLGERQLLCLSRALLCKSKLLLLDEATASVDPETEAAIQATIRNEFQDCTVLTIAHRLQTVGTCDRILVMRNGQVVEYDEPSKLLANPNSEYSKMISAATATDEGTIHG